jgi:hypothetical protein
MDSHKLKIVLIFILAVLAAIYLGLTAATA